MPEANGKATQVCPHCGLEVGNDHASEWEHMDRYHADIVAERRAECAKLLGYAQD